MARPRKKSNSPAQSMLLLLNTAVTLFATPYDDRDEREGPSLNSVAEEMGTTILRARKLLITADYYTTSTSRNVQHLLNEGYNIEEVMKVMGLGRASVYSYIPYKNLAFNLDETTVNADRHRVFRRRVKAIAALQDQPDSLNLWKAMIAFQGYPFKTAGRGSRPGVKFTYEISKEGKDGG